MVVHRVLENACKLVLPVLATPLHPATSEPPVRYWLQYPCTSAGNFERWQAKSCVTSCRDGNIPAPKVSRPIMIGQVSAPSLRGTAPDLREAIPSLREATPGFRATTLTFRVTTPDFRAAASDLREAPPSLRVDAPGFRAVAPSLRVTSSPPCPLCPAYFPLCSIRLLPVISFGCASPISSKMVGDTSARMPRGRIFR